MLALKLNSDLFSPGDRVLAAVSGGPDSMALLHLVLGLRETISFDLAVAHLNHGLRGEESDKDEKLVREFCSLHSIPCHVQKLNVAEIAGSQSKSLELAGRDCRHQFFKSLCLEFGFDKIALAHHADDQIETLLMRVMRGSGVKGFGGMASCREFISGVRIIRPLLELSRGDLIDYLKQNQIPYRLDLSNYLPVANRNILRHDVIPTLDLRHGLEWRKHLTRLSVLAREEWHTATEHLRLDDVLPSSIEKNQLCLSALLPLNLLQRQRMLELWLEKMSGSFQILSGRLLREWNELLDGGRFFVELPKSFMLGENKTACFICREENIVFFGEHPNQAREEARFQQVCLPGQSRLDFFDAELKADIRPLDEALWRGIRQNSNPKMAWIPFELGKNFAVRNWRQGDRFLPLGMKGEKKLQDFFTDEKIPRRHRANIPILCRGEQIVWVMGKRLDDRFKVLPKETTVLELEYVTSTVWRVV